MLSIFLLIPLSLMLFVVAIWAVRYAVKSNQFEDLTMHHSVLYWMTVKNAAKPCRLTKAQHLPSKKIKQRQLMEITNILR
ncbi:cbb3-type cytochrome oxidase assembly protein [Psychrobacter sp. JCM 18900]|uniref:cbb3-type cytochrome oxidase assembly protein n=1 Tax=Psychrobacter sp. JCM 18900 TaxID=1298608 RepID=UPI00351C1F07